LTGGDRDAVAGHRAASDVIDTDIRTPAHLPNWPGPWRDNLSFHDALYVALAVRLAGPLLTGDRRLSGAPALHASVELI